MMQINNHFDAKEAGSVACSRRLGWDQIQYTGSEDACYVMKIVEKASGLIYLTDCLHSKLLDGGQMVQFKYTELYDCHFKYRQLIDGHNNKRHAVPSIEGSLGTQCWAMLVFQFVLAVLEVNLYLANKAFAWSGVKLMNCWLLGVSWHGHSQSTS